MPTFWLKRRYNEIGYFESAQPIESNGLVEFKVEACQKLKTCKYGYTNTETSKSHCHKTNLILQ